MSRSRTIATLFAAFAVGLVAVSTAHAQDDALEVQSIVLRGIPFDVTVSTEAELASLRLAVGGREYAVVAGDDGGAVVTGVSVAETGTVELELRDATGVVATASARAIAAWISIVPPLLAIFLALVFKQVIPALFFGLWVGATAVVGFGPSGWFAGLLDTFQLFVLGALVQTPADSGARVSIILFSFMIGGMVGIVIKNGGMQGVVNIIVRWATSPRRGQATTAALGLIIFFDDYANTLVVGNTMRQVTDRLRVSREKLAYLVDSTAAPVACVALVTTWIGYEVGLIEAAVGRIDELQMSAYSIFLSSIPYSFYPLLTMFFVFVIATSGRDFGPMYAAETRARTTGQLLGPGANVDAAASEGSELRCKEGQPQRAANALVPIAVLIAGVLIGLYVTGTGETLRDIVGSADSYTALMWGSLLSVIAAAVLSGVQRILTIAEIVDAWYAGLKSMLYAMIILVLAWSLSDVSAVLRTADYLVSVLGDALVPGVIPALVFLLAAATAFATGSSWGTMGILMPLVVPLVWAVLQANAMTGDSGLHVLYSTVACVLAGAVFGDHCSPISDTTILSSMASGCDHIEHVRTQMPYAAVVAAVAVGLGTLPAGFGVPWWVSMIVGAGVLFAVARYFGRPVPETPSEAAG